MFSQLARGRISGLSQPQRRLLPLVAAGRKSSNKHSVTSKEARKSLDHLNRQALSRKMPVALFPEDLERLEQQREMMSLAAVQQRAIAEDRERHAAVRRRQTGEDLFKEDNAEEIRQSSSGSSEAFNRSYEDVNAKTGNSVVQEWFDELVHRSILKHCPPSSDALRPSTLLQCIRKEMPGFSFKDHCDGLPFSLMVKNCCYLQSFGGRVSFQPVRREDFDGDDKSFERAGEYVHDQTIVGLRKYKMREVPTSDGIRQGPQPWLFHAGMVPPTRPRRR